MSMNVEVAEFIEDEDTNFKVEDKVNDIADRVESTDDDDAEDSSTEEEYWQAPASDYSHSTSKSRKSGKSSKSSKGSKSSSSKNIEGGAGLKRSLAKFSTWLTHVLILLLLGGLSLLLLGASIILFMYCFLY